MGGYVGQYLIIEFPTQSEAQAALDAINAVAAAWWVQQGYTVQDGQLIGKNAKTGQDAPDAQHTTIWAEIAESPDGTFYFSSLSNDARFPDWKQYVPGSDGWTEKELPAQWAAQEAP